ncbi:MAG: hypothetical protein ACRDG3_09105 [Tepidiformaceae bacterium]
MEATNRRWLLNGRRSAGEVPGNRGFLDHIDVLLTYREQLAEEMRDVDGQLRQLWGDGMLRGTARCTEEPAT